jgi:hypothetical protein
MSETLKRVQQLVAHGEVRISDHGYEEFAADGIVARDVVAGISMAIVVEDYPDAARGPSVLVLQHDAYGLPIHILWGIRAGQIGPAIVITGYRPDPERWSEDFLERKAR